MIESTKYPKELVEEVVKTSLSFAEVFRKLGKKWSGGQQQNLKRWVEKYQVDTSHFLGQASNKGKKSANRKHWSATLVLDETRCWRVKASVLRKALIEYGRPYECAECLGCTWRGKKLTLEVHHKNGDWKDNRPDNLEFMCPNCHAVQVV